MIHDRDPVTTESVYDRLLRLSKYVESLRHSATRLDDAYNARFSSHPWPTITVDTPSLGSVSVRFLSADRAEAITKIVTIYRVNYQLHAWITFANGDWRLNERYRPLERIDKQSTWRHDDFRAARERLGKTLIPELSAALAVDDAVEPARLAAEALQREYERHSVVDHLKRAGAIVDELHAVVAILADHERRLAPEGLCRRLRAAS